jgi:hypothetical protein
MSYDSAITELRQLLSDSDKHKRASKKKLIGNVNGDNKSFQTYDKRVLEDGMEVFVADISVDFSLDDATAGLVTINTAPDKNTTVTASYYYQWWLDAEIKTFLNKGAESCSQFDNTAPEEAYLQINGGLKGAALYLAASYAMDSLVAYLVNRRHSQEYLIEEDGNDDNKFSSTIAAMTEQSKFFWEKGTWLRDDFYKRQGKRNAPAFGIKTVTQRRYGPYR